MARNELIKLEIKNDIAYVGMGLKTEKSMTVFNKETLLELSDVLEEVKKLDHENAIKGVIFHSLKSGVFVAGADIELISSMSTESEAQTGSEWGQNLFNIIEDLTIPTICCVDGIALGGGLEFALSCQKIICSDSKKTILGLPEVKLGILPGWGGTYRLPKKIGLPESLSMILSGSTVDAKKAKKIGLVEETYPTEFLLEKALVHLFKPVPPESFSHILGDMVKDNLVTRKIIFQKAREGVIEKTKGFYEAPLKILDLLENSSGKGRTAHLLSESNAFAELAIGLQSSNLRHIYFLTEKNKKYPGPKSSGNLLEINRGAALGAGTMGGGIAWLMANNDMKPIMKDLSEKAIEIGLKQASANYASALKRKKMTRDDFERKMRSISGQLDYRGFNRIDLVVEAVVENMDIKKKVFAEAEKNVRADCILASNTSSLSIEEMSHALEKPERFLGIHFFNPVNKMPLVEIITHSKVSPETLEAAYKWVLKTKKTPVIVKDGPGFLVNRILGPYLNEAAYLLEEGVSIQDIDEACLNFGMPMGACRLMDEIGIDVADKVGKILNAGLGDRVKPNELSHKMVEAGLLGRKSNKGFYLFNTDGKDAVVNPDAEKLLPRRKIKMSEIDIQMRLILPMINEAAACLHDGITTSASEVDLALIFGIGFPPFKGGLLRYADYEGLDRIVTGLERFSESVDKARFTPHIYLKNIVGQKKKFYDA